MVRSPAALAKVKQALTEFKHKQNKQTLQTSFIPATMDELMSNLVVNLKRKENLETFDQEARLFYKKSLANTDSESIR